jgi:hypothetical protein
MNHIDLSNTHNTIFSSISNALKNIKLVLIHNINVTDIEYTAKYRVVYNKIPAFIVTIKTDINKTKITAENFVLDIEISHPDQILNDGHSKLYYNIIINKLTNISNFIITKNKELKKKFITDSKLNNTSNYDIIWIKYSRTLYFLIRITSHGYILSKFIKHYNTAQNNYINKNNDLSKFYSIVQDYDFKELYFESIDDIIKYPELESIINTTYNCIGYFFI